LLEVILPIAIDVTVVVCRKAAGQNEMPFAGHTRGLKLEEADVV